MTTYPPSELILNPDGSIFHLHLFPEQLTDNVILVGDPSRVALVGEFLEGVEPLAANREFVSLTGYYTKQKITVLSTGIGTDNVDIVVNELDALANINLKTRQDHAVHRSLNLIRMGTSGSLQSLLPTGTVVSSAWSIGLDGLMKYYARPADPERDDFEQAFLNAVHWPDILPLPYAVRSSEKLLKLVEPISVKGITVAAHGFYGPQGRQLRAKLAVPDLNSRLESFRYRGLHTTNFEMESSGLYGLAQLLDHEAITVCLIIANRMMGTFLGDYKPEITKLIDNVLHSIIK